MAGQIRPIGRIFDELVADWAGPPSSSTNSSRNGPIVPPSTIQPMIEPTHVAGSYSLRFSNR
jgi:hypothetical protein